MSPYRRTWPALAAVAALLATACSESTAPANLSDPAALNAELQAVGASTQSQVIEGFTALSEYMSPTGAPLPGAAALLGATAPGWAQHAAPLRAAASPRYARSARTADALRAAVPQFSGPRPGPIIPDSYYGKTYEWDMGLGHYVETTRTGAPTNGIRFIVYAINPLTGLPAEPLAEVGYVDLMDESVSPALQLHVVVSNTDGSVTYAEYTVSVTPGASSFAASATGFVTNGLAGAAERRLDFAVQFTASGTATTADLTADATLDLNNSTVTLEVHDTAHLAGSTWTFSRDFRFHRPGEVIRMLGTLTVTETSPLVYSVSGDLTISVGGELFVHVTISDEGFTANRELSPAEREAVGRLLDAADGVWDAVEHFFHPAENFVGV
jgi:hypothetical protein